MRVFLVVSLQYEVNVSKTLACYMNYKLNLNNT